MMLLAKLILRNAWRHKLRAGLSFFTIFFATILGHLYVGGRAALDGIFEAPFFSGTTFVKGLGAPAVATLPNSYAEEIRAIPGIVAATPIVQYELPLAGGRGGGWLMLGVNPVPFREIVGTDLDSIRPEMYEKFIQDPSALLLSKGAELAYEWRVGDRVDIPLRVSMESAVGEGRAPATTSATMSGHFLGVIEKGIFSDRVVICHASALEKLFDWYRGGGVIAKFGPSQDAEVVAKRIEEHFASGGRERVDVMMLDLWVEGVRTFVSQLSTAVLFIIGLLGLFALVIMVFNVTMAGIDLLPQIGTLRAVGLSRREALVVLAGEGMMVTFGSALFATLVIYVVTAHTHMIDLTNVDQFLAPIFSVTLRGTASVLVIAFALGIVGSVLPFVGAVRSSVVQLRRR